MVNVTREKGRVLAQNGKVKAVELSSEGNQTVVDISTQVIALSPCSLFARTFMSSVSLLRLGSKFSRPNGHRGISSGSSICSSDKSCPCTRSRFSKNQDKINGFTALMACQESKEVSMWSSNAELVESMIRSSRGELQMKNTVLHIGRSHDRRYILLTVHSSDASAEEQLEFHAVILPGSAQHLLLKNPSLPPDAAHQDEAPGASLSTQHVTHFATPDHLSPDYFNISVGVELPDRILTTTTDTTDPDLLLVHQFMHHFSREDRAAHVEQRERQHKECATNDIGYENAYRIVSKRWLEDKDCSISWESLGPGEALSKAGLIWVH
ncbi:hypothetical protein FB567DRAFT_617166 [Paraphoma chrysanthemicola]|uniref:Prenylcysteine lyase domain-containing protein n=1 Tax=Paraphoma chrysanthemicola TaxID=798071 RepID=A0A8K0RFC6_9PLEO|nr:hypothetical protein FB567DRAFT_617166 [Paraphoma chrysanthemicola]